TGHPATGDLRRRGGDDVEHVRHVLHGVHEDDVARLERPARHGVELRGKEVLVVGRGVTVGRPIGLLLTRREINATVTLAHTGTQDLDSLLARADVVVAAAGQPHMIGAEQIKEGAVLLDVGVSRVEDPQKGKKVLTGDIDPAAAERASWMSPNPGGVGPMTRAMLLVNVVTAAERLAQQG
ncbi:MAG: hypothetical protein L0G19_04195, partial [Micrococcales bacterium]|nr:hypothetical protein [Micrococcales bacterium]